MKRQRDHRRHLGGASGSEPAGEARERPLGVVASEVRHADRGVDEDVAEMQVSLLLRDETLAMLLDDIKEPLYGIALNASIIERVAVGAQGATSRVREAVNEVRGALSQVHVLVGALLEVDRVDGAELAVDMRPQDTPALVEVAARVIQPLLRARRVQLTVRVRPPAERLECDRVRMVQALAALLLEATRRTPAGGRVQLDATHTGMKVHLAVQDGGPHLSDAQVAELLAPATYERGALRPPRMVMARRVVELHGGALEARAEPSGGMVFDAVIPSRYGRP